MGSTWTDETTTVASGNMTLRLKVETDPFEIACLQSELSMLQERHRALVLENAELRAMLAKQKRKL